MFDFFFLPQLRPRGGGVKALMALPFFVAFLSVREKYVFFPGPVSCRKQIDRVTKNICFYLIPWASDAGALPPPPLIHILYTAVLRPPRLQFIQSFIHSCIYSFLHLFIPSFIHSFIYSFLHLWIPSFLPSFYYSFIPSFLQSFMYSFIHSLINSWINSYIIHPFINTFINASISLFFHLLDNQLIDWLIDRLVTCEWCSMVQTRQKNLVFTNSPVPFHYKTKSFLLNCCKLNGILAVWLATTRSKSHQLSNPVFRGMTGLGFNRSIDLEVLVVLVS